LLCVYAFAVNIPNLFSSGDVISAAKMNANFDAVKTAVNTLETKATTTESKTATLETTQPGQTSFESGSGGAIPATTGAMAKPLQAPSNGFAIVTASRSVYWTLTAGEAGLMRLKISKTSGDTDETPGIQFIRFPSAPAGNQVFPFSTTKVFPVTAGANQFFLNAWRQIGTSSASLDDHTLVVQFVPKAY
jgi:hypothetical protein